MSVCNTAENLRYPPRRRIAKNSRTRRDVGWTRATVAAGEAGNESLMGDSVAFSPGLSRRAKGYSFDGGRGGVRIPRFIVAGADGVVANPAGFH
jgi:hypothetical protein